MFEIKSSNFHQLAHSAAASFARMFRKATFLVVYMASALSVLAAAGELDPTFGSGGTVITDMPGDNFAREVKTQPDDKIVVLGHIRDASGYTTDSYLARYHSNGNLDTRFGENGFVYAQKFGATFGEGFVILPDGRLLVVGYIFNPGEETGGAAVFRFNANGALDASWGKNGIVATLIVSSGNYGNEIIVKPDGKILNFVEGAFIVRYNADGSLDTAYGSGGVSVLGNLSGAGTGRFYQVEQTPDGKILFLNRFVAFGQQTPINYIGRLNANDTLDNSFGANGYIQFQSDLAWGNTFAQQSDGKIIVLTRTTQIRGTIRTVTSGVTRYTANGMSDFTFGTPRFPYGYRSFSLAPSAGASFELTSILVQPNNRIVLGGTKVTALSRSFVLLRLDRNGVIDRSFGAEGFAVVALRGVDDFLTALTLQPDGNLVAVGDIAAVYGERSYDLGLARFLNTPGALPAQFDFDGDGKSDVSVFRPENGFWYSLNSASGSVFEIKFGLANDKLAPADYDGDGKTDMTVFRDGTWYLNFFAAFPIQLGQAGDAPVPADYDGDGRADIAVFSAGVWHIRLSSENNRIRVAQFGLPTDKPVIGDFDGDGLSDLAVYRSGTWFVEGSRVGFFAQQFGLGSDVPAAADYDADGKTDFAVFRSGVWYILGTTRGFYTIQFGLTGDAPVPADYDGDGRTDVAIYRNGVWYLLRSQSGFTAVQFGKTGDKPVQAAFLP